jgi:hypothetical protein
MMMIVPIMVVKMRSRAEWSMEMYHGIFLGLFNGHSSPGAGFVIPQV